MTIPPIEAICPYVGLQPFREEDREYFFGRERDQRIIIANLIASPLTILYGSSGVGKSSVLMAGVVPQLRRERPRTPVIVFREWVGEDFRDRLARACIDAVWSGRVSDPRPAETLPLDDLLRACADAAHETVVVLLDQFEEYFLYHRKTIDPSAFEAQFARAVNRDDVDVGFLLAMREDGLSKLDRFQERIPNLLSNRLRLEHLDAAGATAATRRPLEVWNRRSPTGTPPVTIEDDLVAALLEQIRIGRVSVSRHAGSAGADTTERLVEAPFLQLVLTRLWAQEMASGSRRLRRATFDSLGGAQAIVRNHLGDVMKRLDPSGQAVCASFFDRLVTPSGGKVACSLDDLSRWSGALAAEVPGVLQALSRERILRTTAAVPERPEATYYEIYHDVLAPAVLDWRRAYEVRRERADAERRYREATRRRRQLRMLIAASSFTLVTASGWLYSFYQQTRAEANAIAARVPSLAQTDASRALDLALAAAGELRRFGLDATPATEDALRHALRAASHDPVTLPVGDWVWDVAISPDGGTLAVASRDQRATLWDLAARGFDAPSATLAHDQSVRKVVFLDGGRLLTVSGHLARIWDLRSTAVVAAFDHGSNIFAALAASPDGGRIATAGQGAQGRQRVIRVWDLAEPALPLREIDVQGAWVMGLAFSPDGCCLATAMVERGAPTRRFTEVWAIASGTRILSVPNPVEADAVEFTPDGKKIVVASRDNRVRVFRPARGELDRILAEHARLGTEVVDLPWDVDLLAGHTERIRDVAVSADGTRIASASGDRTARIWDAATGEGLLSLLGHQHWVESATFSGDGRRVATGARDGTVELWDVTRHLAPLHGIAFAADNRTVATASVDRTAKIWDVGGDSPALRLTLAGHAGEVYRVAFDPAGRRLATASFDGTARLWDASTGAMLAELAIATDQLRDLAFSPDGRQLAVAAADGHARLFTVDDTSAAPAAVKVPPTKSSKRAQILAVAFHPHDGTWLTASSDGLLQRWSRTGEASGEISLPGRQFADVGFSPDGTQVAALSHNRIHVWNTEDLAASRVDGRRELLVDDETFCSSLDFSPDGGQLAVACADNAVRLVSLRTGGIVETISAHNGAVSEARFSPDGTRLATASADRTFAVTPLAFKDLHQLAQRVRQAKSRVERAPGDAD